ncbi:unnamed protein product [Mytilus edulis]|uniref:Endonuclease/exonuclease/phosphatase domain-containing protein n=1 Tax=Mytilus edulis TaxID=6550 RepID=A0A8S3VIS2_MYTED|nr:unnamed protein product [Mytilus edulis]
MKIEKLGYKKEIASKIKPLSTHCKYVLWFKVSSDLLNLDQDIVIGIVYIPPEYTAFSSHDAFSQLEDEYTNFSKNYKFVALIGDFNGRTANDDDFFLSKEMHGNNAANFVENDVLTLDLLNIPRKRNSLDPIRNRYGNKILDFCKGNNLFIVNGRIGEDRMTGKLTCKNASIVDYCISSTSLLKYFRNFSVLDFSHFYSDVHCALAISLSGLSLKNVEETGKS